MIQGVPSMGRNRKVGSRISKVSEVETSQDRSSKQEFQVLKGTFIRDCT